MCRKEVRILEELRERKQYWQNTLYKFFLKIHEEIGKSFLNK